MNSLLLRPRFSKQIHIKPEEVINRIHSYLKKPNRPVDGTIMENRIHFKFPPESRHYWSPQLNLEVIEEGGNTLLRGLFGPDPKVWSMFLFIYSGIGFIGIIGLLFGLAQWNLGITPDALWIALGSVFLEIIFYFIARLGKKIAAQQMTLLQKELSSIIGMKN